MYTALQMEPKFSAGILVATAFALTLPFVSFALFLAFRFPSGQWPAWSTNVLMLWFVANFLVMILVARKMYRKRTLKTDINPQPIGKRRASVWIVRAIASYLVIVWSVFFVKGVEGTIEGKYALNRAIPAGLFLLFLILLFSWSVYRTFQKRG